MSSLSAAGKSFKNNRRILAVLFGLGFIAGFLLTPLVFEPRINELRNPGIPVFFIVAGLLLPLAGLILLFKKPKIAGILAIIDAALLFLTAPADQLKFFFTVPPPAAVTIGEFVLIFIGIGYMLYGQRIYLDSIRKADNP